jgi:hypothetical protein
MYLQSICFHIKLYFLLLTIIDLLIFCLTVRITEAKQRITPFNEVFMSFNLTGLRHIIYLYYIHIII